MSHWSVLFGWDITASSPAVIGFLFQVSLEQLIFIFDHKTVVRLLVFWLGHLDALIYIWNLSCPETIQLAVRYEAVVDWVGKYADGLADRRLSWQLKGRFTLRHKVRKQSIGQEFSREEPLDLLFYRQVLSSSWGASIACSLRRKSAGKSNLQPMSSGRNHGTLKLNNDAKFTEKDKVEQLVK
jgi:hypothetical protein